MAGDQAQFSVEWIDHRREPTEVPDLRYPDGIDLDISQGEKSCLVQLPYPAKRCGHFVVRCQHCGMSVAVTTAGRIDDPKSVRIPCRKLNLSDSLEPYER